MIPVIHPTLLLNPEAPVSVCNAIARQFVNLRLGVRVAKQALQSASRRRDGRVVGSMLLRLARKVASPAVIHTASNADSETWAREREAHHVLDYRKPLARGIAANRNSVGRLRPASAQRKNTSSKLSRR
jgi:hypothetical protein